METWLKSMQIARGLRLRASECLLDGASIECVIEILKEIEVFEKESRLGTHTE